MLKQWVKIGGLVCLGLFGMAAPTVALSQVRPDCLIQRNVDGSLSGKCPTVVPKEQTGVFFDAEFLYMQADVDGLAYAWTFPEAFPSAAGDIARTGPLPGGVTHDLHFQWDPGVRLAAGYRFPDNLWEFSGVWTYYRNHSKGRASTPSLLNETLIATWFPAGFNANEYMAMNGNADWTLVYNTVDLCLGRAAFTTQRIAIEPILGLRGAFLHQRFNASYTNGYFFNTVGTEATSVVATGKNSFDGWGIRPGINTNWYLNHEVSIYANGAMSLLFGQYTVTTRERMTNPPNRNFITANDSYYQSAFEIDLGAGVKVEKYWFGNHFVFSVGYEIMSWFDQNQLFNYFFIDRIPGGGQPAEGDLGIQGINATFHFDY